MTAGRTVVAGAGRLARPALGVALALTLCATGASAARAETSLDAPMPAAEVGVRSDLVRVSVPGVGPVRLSARRDGQRVQIWASAPDGTVIGRADSVAGIGETAVYVQAGKGLEKITVRWPATD